MTSRDRARANRHERGGEECTLQLGSNHLNPIPLDYLQRSEQERDFWRWAESRQKEFGIKERSLKFKVKKRQEELR